MGKRDEIYSDFSENGYPTDPLEKKEFAVDLFGARLVGAIESVLEDKMKIIDGIDEKSKSYNFLQKLNTDDKEELKKFMSQMTGDSFYWQLVKMTSFPDSVEINLLEEQDNKLKKICEVQDDMELKHLYFEWIEKFSDYIEE